MGEVITYHENGKRVKHYKEGKLVLTELYDDNGNLKEKKEAKPQETQQEG